MAGVIIPKTYVKHIKEPILFLAGPIRGAPNWQDEAIKTSIDKRDDITIITPRRGIRPAIEPYILQGDENIFKRQRAWERHYLHEASKKGVIAFWLPGEVEHTCEKSYGAMTRIELGQWMTRYSLDHSTRFCVGTDGKFSEIDTIAYDLVLDAPDKKIQNSLEALCDEALRIISKN